MRIVFFGSPASALPSFLRLIDEGHILQLVVTQPDRPSGRGKKIQYSPIKKKALDLGIPVFQPGRIRKDPKALQRMREYQPELNVVVAYGQIIPAEIIYFPRYNSINVHFSLLPKYRGASPVQWALLNGEIKTGITIMELNEKMDEGDILSQKEIDILPDESADRLESRLAEAGAEMLVKTIAEIEEITPAKQDHSLATYAPKIKKEDGRIDWKENARFLERKIRAFSPWPSLFCFIGQRRLKVLEGKTIPFTGKDIPPPGQIIDIDSMGIQIACGGKSVFLLETLQPENKSAMNAYAFSLGRHLKPGDSFD
jgi:methionyl-tRNA formyltransferase